MLDKAIRELDRERMALQNQEKKVIAEIKKTAKQGQMVGRQMPHALVAILVQSNTLDLAHRMQSR